jgi:ribonuclease R
MGIKQSLVSFMQEPAYRPMELEDLVAIFDIKKNEYNAFKKTLRMMENEGLIIRNEKNKYMMLKVIMMWKG